MVSNRQMTLFFFCNLTYIKQETKLSLTNRATHLCKCNGVAYL